MFRLWGERSEPMLYYIFDYQFILIKENNKNKRERGLSIKKCSDWVARIVKLSIKKCSDCGANEVSPCYIISLLIKDNNKNNNNNNKNKRERIIL